jgi:hypothetical protein
MVDDPNALEQTEARRQAQKLAQEVEEAAEDLERNGPVSAADVRARLLRLEAEWGAQGPSESRKGKARRLPR